jgi:hypothetical protein
MTNEQKLLKLLNIAVDNGWKDENRFIDLIEVWEGYIENNCLQTKYNDNEMYSLDDLVTRFDEKSTNFTLALFYANPSKAWDKITDEVTSFYIEGMNCSQTIILNWTTQKVSDKYTTRPSNDRLAWLFDLFSHLLN